MKLELQEMDPPNEFRFWNLDYGIIRSPAHRFSTFHFSFLYLPY